jgi:hypothetical protein
MILILMVNTSSNLMTSCTLRLSMYSHHGPVFTDDILRVFKSGWKVSSTGLSETVDTAAGAALWDNGKWD